MGIHITYCVVMVNISKKLHGNANLERIVLSKCSEYCPSHYKQGVYLRTVLQFPHGAFCRLN